MGVEAFRIEHAREQDVPLILSLVKELAAYERLSNEVTATEAGLRRALFGPSPAAEAIIGCAGHDAVGFALFFQNFSTFVGKPGLYLEDLFVRPEWRGRGFGGRLLAYLARLAVERDYGRMEWSVLDWNELALGVYRRIGARSMDDWRIQRLTGDALRQLASQA
jgi:GNAT superfamily N-acetyltransferase